MHEIQCTSFWSVPLRQGDSTWMSNSAACDGEESARNEFIELISDLVKYGKAERVLDCCHELLAEDPDPSSGIVAELTDLIHQARRSLMTAMN